MKPSRINNKRNMNGQQTKYFRYGWLTAVVLFVAILAGLIYLFNLKSSENVEPVVKEQVEPGLGESGAACGGKKRLPCRPGNVCTITDDVTAEGVCVTVDANPAPVIPD